MEITNLNKYTINHAENIKNIKIDYEEILQAIGIGYPTYEVACLLKRLGELWNKDVNYTYTTGDKNVDLYYILMCIRNIYPNLFPSHDLCFFAAEQLHKQIKEYLPKIPSVEESPTKGNLNKILFDMELLPILILAIKSIPDLIMYANCNSSNYEQYTKESIENLNTLFPDCDFQCSDQNKERILKNAWVLLQNSKIHYDLDNNYLKVLQNIRGGVVLASWNFLGANVHSNDRELWVKSGLLQKIVQLPRPKRQKVSAHPCLITLGMMDTKSNIDLFHIQGNLMEYVNHNNELIKTHSSSSLPEPYTVESINISPDAILKNAICNLTPAYYLAESKVLNTSSIKMQTSLRDVAHVLRYQDTRIRIDNSFLVKDKNSSSVLREITLKELDPMTGFIDRFGGALVMKKSGIKSKYIIQPNDIVFAYRGSRNSIGKVGFADKYILPNKIMDTSTNAHSTKHIQTYAITSASLCIIRPFNIDAIWLYYFLQKISVQELLCSKASGSHLLTLNIENIRNTPIQIPNQEEVEFVNKEFNAIALEMEEINIKKDTISMSLERLNEAMKQNNESDMEKE